ncbi:nitrite reductase small subunit NirD [Vibrio gigantis]|uniref:Nitrite reductase small subunit NirD n=1 Tax=Vibrio gigantis TaxID=296199 RepID=A0A5M9N857_9VIBR|nr:MULTISPECIES: nitrite reductase small subunit NirD [Vibrio]KAA8666624.1 nitrite reductase small subunit NirD [Vibrio gigantis]MBY7730189.1 nitrite reductase small subunit NirD [Vibrio splendidus]ULN67034.1 nitrite reductase small subunit NirD [Vibrio gigantis]WKY59658.1 nitrite reductase small subunit NirD [Vibrio sp. SNU_ST1]
MENWTTVCSTRDLTPNGGICAKVDDNQVAIFYCKRSDTLYGLSNFDPIGKANVMSRGIIGSLSGEPYVASPLYKQHYHLETGECLEQPELKLVKFEVRKLGEQVQVLAPLAIAS